MRGTFISLILVFVLRANLTSQSTSSDPPTLPPPAASAPKTAYFSGFVTEKSATSITVSRKGMAKDTVQRIFHMDAQTKVEGNLKLTARVTVRYESGPDGDRAVRILVRGAAGETAH